MKEQTTKWNKGSIIQLGNIYYSVGPLQNTHSIEEWVYSDDKYDHSRLSIGNVFNTKEEARKFKEYIRAYHY